MSEQATTERAFVDFAHQGDIPFGALMDALVADDAQEGGPGAPGSSESGGTGAPAPAGGPAQAGAPGGPGAPRDSAAPAGPAADAGDSVHPPAPAGVQGQPGEPAAGGAEQPPAVSPPAVDGFDPRPVATEIGGLSTAFEERLTKNLQYEAYDTAREEYENYFQAIEKHPRLLVGTEVPRIGEEGMEILRSTEDAKEWQEAVKSLLVEEINAKVEGQLDESRQFLELIHSSIDLFKDNPDLIPGARGFNKTLADEFAKMAEPYEIRYDGLLHGYSIPVQPIIDQLRKQIQARRAPAAKPAATPAATSVSQSKPRTDPPQAGIASKAGSSSEAEDFSTLFGTIGLPHLQI